MEEAPQGHPDVAHVPAERDAGARRIVAKDPDNRFFWRANRSRLEAEGVWDVLLQASGSLDLKALADRRKTLPRRWSAAASTPRSAGCIRTTFQATFDLPPATISAEKRYVTNVPQQRLFFLNNSFVHKQAEALAERVKSAGERRSAGEEGVRDRLPARADA